MKISKQKQEKISEQILALLYPLFPKSMFTSHIAREIARDEEFTKRILLNLKNKGLVVEIKKNMKGEQYLKRIRWRLSNLTFEAYKSSIF